MGREYSNSLSVEMLEWYMERGYRVVINNGRITEWEVEE